MGEREESRAVVEEPERRQSPRVEAALRVEYESLDDLVIAYTTDISRGGLFVNTREFLPVGTFVAIDLSLPDDITVRTIGRVAHVVEEESRAGMGMELLDVERGGLADQLGSYLNVMLGGDTQVLPESDPHCRVLVVDDDAAYREQVAMVMRKRGHTVEEAENGLLALGAVLRDPPDLIITDVQMPVMDGWHFLRVLRGRPSVAHIPVIFLTGLTSEQERLKGYKLGVDDYINKPFLFEELAARVSCVLMRGSSAASRNALRGDLAQVSLASVLQFVEIEKRTGLLLLVSNEELATLHLRDGRVVHVDFGIPSPETGFERLMRVLDWTTGRFELTGAEVAAEDTIEEPISYALLEHARRRDESQ